MRIAIPRETHPGENRVPIIPAVAKKLVGLGAQVVIESGMGIGSGFSDEDYIQAGASVDDDRDQLISSADHSPSSWACSRPMLNRRSR